MICPPCRNETHEQCVDTVRPPDPTVSSSGKALPRSRSCFCQHKVKPAPAKSETADPHDC